MSGGLCVLVYGYGTWFDHRKIADSYSNRSLVTEEETSRIVVRQIMLTIFLKWIGVVHLSFS